MRQCSVFSEMTALLESLCESLEICWKAATRLVDEKRERFPRFYFLSTKDVLHVICNGLYTIAFSFNSLFDKFLLLSRLFTAYSLPSFSMLKNLTYLK